MNDWAPLRKATQARIGLRRAGAAVSTRDLLEFQLAHAQARDAVWHSWDSAACAVELEQREIKTLQVTSAAPDRQTYLTRPDLGRRLDAESLVQLTAAAEEPPPDVALILSDGLSATAVQQHGVATIEAMLTALKGASLRTSPVVLVERGRVGLSDEIGHALHARIAVIVLGERPGLSAADSLGIYLTHSPAPGNTDAQRNCLSNVRTPGGLPPQLAAARLVALLRRSLALGLSGVALKDDAAALLTP
ncbi:MAG: ethanolamine ammonia-lyase subunit EutC [Polyangiales bacterium]